MSFTGSFIQYKPVAIFSGVCDVRNIVLEQKYETEQVNEEGRVNRYRTSREKSRKKKRTNSTRDPTTLGFFVPHTCVGSV